MSGLIDQISYKQNLKTNNYMFIEKKEKNIHTLICFIPKL